MHHSEILLALSGDNLSEQTGIEYLHDCFRQAVGGDEVPTEQVAQKIKFLLAAGIIQGNDQHYQFTPKWLGMVEAEQYKWFNTTYQRQRVVLTASDFNRDNSCEMVYILTCQSAYPYFAQTLLAIEQVLEKWLTTGSNGPIALGEMEGTFSLLDIDNYADGYFNQLLSSYGVIDLAIEAIPLAWHPVDSSLWRT